MPYTVRQEIARLLSEMQRNRVIQPSNSPWASPVVLVKKRDGTHRFCVDYRALNAVTKTDSFPLPRIEDLLDQLGESKYFSTLDLASGFWQIRMDPSAQEKTAFVTHQGLYEFRVMKTNPRLVAAVSDFPVPDSVQGVWRFLGLASYYRKFIPNFSRIAHPLHQLTCKAASFKWSPECSCAFEELKHRLTTAPILAYPNFTCDFVLETDASMQGVGAVLGQYQDDNKLHPIGYASRALNAAEKRYGITELETLAVVWAISHFHHYLYGNRVTVFTDHTAVKAILESSNLTAKHARWWTRVYGRRVREVRIRYRAGHENRNADALSRSPMLPAPDVGIAEAEFQVSLVDSRDDPGPIGGASEFSAQTSSDPVQPVLTANQRRSQSDDNPDKTNDTVKLFYNQSSDKLDSISKEQQEDPDVREIFQFIVTGTLPEDDQKARKLALQETLFTVTNNILYFLDPKRENRKRVVVPRQLRRKILENTHSGPFGGHFSGQRLYNSLVSHWWWSGMFQDAVRFAKNCPEWAVAKGIGRRAKPPLHPIPVSRPFQLLGIDIMDLPLTEKGNKHVVVVQDLFTKWPMVFAVPDQKTTRIAKLIAEEVIPVFGVPECLLSDRGTNLLSSLMQDLCRILGITKLNTTAYHPQCDDAVERFNRTLKTILHKHAAKFGSRWDRFLPGILWAYRNTPHTSTGEKPSFLLYGLDCRSPTEAAYLPTTDIHPIDVKDYREELMVSLTSARQIATSCIQRAQAHFSFRDCT